MCHTQALQSAARQETMDQKEFLFFLEKSGVMENDSVKGAVAAVPVLKYGKARDLSIAEALEEHISSGEANDSRLGGLTRQVLSKKQVFGLLHMTLSMLFFSLSFLLRGQQSD